MLSIGKVVDDLDKQGKKPNSPNYAKGMRSEILFHFEIEENDLDKDDKTKFVNDTKNFAKKCKEMLESAQTVSKMLSYDVNKVRQFMVYVFLCSVHYKEKSKVKKILEFFSWNQT